MNSNSFQNRFKNKISLLSKEGLLEISERNRIVKETIPSNKSHFLSPVPFSVKLTSGVESPAIRCLNKTKTLSNLTSNLNHFNSFIPYSKKQFETERDHKFTFNFQDLPQKSNKITLKPLEKDFKKIRHYSEVGIIKTSRFDLVDKEKEILWFTQKGRKLSKS